MNRTNYQEDTHCPKGYRLLIQLFEETSEDEARASVLRIFGPRKARKAVLTRGTYTWQGTTTVYPRVFQGSGFRVYLPIRRAW
jgi:hypothetical protein